MPVMTLPVVPGSDWSQNGHGCAACTQQQLRVNQGESSRNGTYRCSSWVCARWESYRWHIIAFMGSCAST